MHFFSQDVRKCILGGTLLSKARILEKQSRIGAMLRGQRRKKHQMSTHGVRYLASVMLFYALMSPERGRYSYHLSLLQRRQLRPREGEK